MLLWEHAALLRSVLIVLLEHFGSGRRSGASARSAAGGCVDYMLWVPRPVQGHLWQGVIVQLLGPLAGRAGCGSVSGDVNLSCSEVLSSFVLYEAVGVFVGLRVASPCLRASSSVCTRAWKVLCFSSPHCGIAEAFCLAMCSAWK